MTDQQIRALEYVRNSNGGATEDDFIEDWEPIGKQLWDDIKDFIFIDNRKKIYITTEGLKIINQFYKKEKK